MRTLITILLLTITLIGCASSSQAPAIRPTDKEWTQLDADYQWIQTLRKSAPVLAPTATRKQIIETRLENDRKVESTYVPFMDRLREYYDRTADPRAAKLLAHEKVVTGDEYMNVLSRYDRAIEFYKSALQLDPQNAEATDRLQRAEGKRYASMASFAGIKAGVKEDDIRRILGLPREDWIKQVVQNGRVYSVWIYPKQDGGAAAVYFDNGVVYHTNWNAAPGKN